MILNFKTQINGNPTNFKAKILSGQKIHTIRKKGRWKVGDTIHFSTGARSSDYECFKVGTVVSVQNIQIERGFLTQILLDGEYLDDNLLIPFAKNDGFDVFLDFEKWFKDGGEFDLIHWPDKKY